MVTGISWPPSARAPQPRATHRLRTPRGDPSARRGAVRTQPGAARRGPSGALGWLLARGSTSRGLHNLRPRAVFEDADLREQHRDRLERAAHVAGALLRERRGPDAKVRGSGRVHGVLDQDQSRDQAPGALPHVLGELVQSLERTAADRKSTRLNSSHVKISYAVFCLKKKI